MKKLYKYSLNLSLACLLALSSPFISSAQKDTIIKDTVKVSRPKPLADFSTIRIKGPLNIKLLQGPANQLTLPLNATSASYEVKNGALIIYGSLPKNVFITITSKNLNNLECTGGGAYVKSGMLSSDEFRLLVSGAPKLVLSLQVNRLNSDIKGAATVVLKGTAGLHDLKVSGASTVNASGLITSKTVFRISGASNTNLNVRDTLIGNLSGVSNIVNTIEPVYKNIKTSGMSVYSTEVKDSTSKNDTTKIRVGKKSIIIIKKGDNNIDEAEEKDVDNESGKIELDSLKANKPKKPKKFKIYWSGVGYGINGFMFNGKTSMPQGYDFLGLNYGKSTNVTINIFEEHLPLIREHINLITGLGYEINNYRFDNNYVLKPDAKTISATRIDTISFKKNKLSDSWVTVPVLLQFDTRKLHKNSTLHLSAGLVGGIRVNSHTKQVYSLNNKTYKPKQHDDFNQPLLKYSAMVRIGYGKLDLFATYQLNSMFKSNEGPDIHPFLVGITLASFSR